MLGSDQRERLAQLMSQLAFIAALSWEKSVLLSQELIGDPLEARVDRYFPDGSRAQTSAQGAVMALVLVGATLIIGIVVYAEIDAAAPDNHALNGTQESVTDNVTSGFDLGSILPIVIAAGAVLGILVGFGGLGGGNGGRR